MESTKQEAPRLPPPVIAIPSALDEDFRQRLLGLKNARIVEQENHGYVDVGENTLVHLLDARALQPGINDRSLVETLGDMTKRCEYPVLLIVGNLYGKPPVDIPRSRSIAGFITHLELFTRIRAIQAPDRFHAVMMLQLLAKQAQRGFHSLGLEDL